MTNQTTIGIGETSSFRYIGIKPPIDDVLACQIIGEIDIPTWLSYFYRVGVHEECGNDGVLYTEFSFDIGDAIDDRGREEVEEATLDIAYQIAELLEKLGHEIIMLDEEVTIDFQTPLFGEEADFNRELSRFFRLKGPNSNQ